MNNYICIDGVKHYLRVAKKEDKIYCKDCSLFASCDCYTVDINCPNFCWAEVFAYNDVKLPQDGTIRTYFSLEPSTNLNINQNE